MSDELRRQLRKLRQEILGRKEGEVDSPWGHSAESINKDFDAMIKTKMEQDPTLAEEEIYAWLDHELRVVYGVADDGGRDTA